MSLLASRSLSTRAGPPNIRDGMKAAKAEAQRENEPGCSSKSLVGIKDALERLEIDLKEIDGRRGTNRLLGILGMGGIGKTTLAMKFFNSRKELYAYNCFTKDVTNVKGSVEDAILAHIHKGTQKAKLTSLSELDGESLLLVLDDVVSEKDLEILSVLTGDQVCVSSDSLFIATSRDSELLKSWVKHPVSLLGPKHSNQLLQTYAFPLKDFPDGVPKEYESAFFLVTKTCNGLPLTLEVIGKYLCKKPNVIWEQTVQALIRGMEVVGLDKKLWATLKLSYDRLSKMEQSVFLDAATVFDGKDLDEAKAAWSVSTEGSQDMIWQHLVDLCLVREISYEDESEFSDKWGEIPSLDWNEIWNRKKKIGMHEQLKSLGKKIASRAGENGRRMWETGGENDAAVELHPIENYEDDAKDIVSLKLSLDDLYSGKDGGHSSNESSKYDSKQCQIDFRSKLSKMGNLQYLNLLSFNMDSSCTAPLPSTLVSLHLRVATFAKLPFTPRNHRSMAILKLDSCTGLTALPENFGQLSSLRVLHISDCGKLTRLPDSLGNLIELRDLEIIDCEGLKDLPTTLGKLARLERVVLDKCRLLSCLPNELCNRGSLKTLKIEACSKFPKLPENFGKLTALEVLVLKDWSRLSELPHEFGTLAALQHLVINKCEGLQSLPESLGDLRDLKDLEITECDLRQLPTTIGKLKNLERVVLGSCKKLSNLPNEFCELMSLKKLQIEACHQLQGLPENFGNLTGLEILFLKDWPRLSELPDFDNLTALQYLVLNKCELLKSLPDSFGKLHKLQYLVLSKCKLLESLPDSLGNLKGLKDLEISECETLWQLPKTLGNLPKLENVVLNKCKRLGDLGESFGGLQQLKVLHIEGCDALHTLPEKFLELPALVEITLSGICLSTAPDFSELKSLKTLKITWKKGTEFPTLPGWLGKEITKENYGRKQLFTFNIVWRESRKEAVFQKVPSNRRIQHRMTLKATA